MASESGQLKVIGGEKNFWLYSETNGFDLTHPPTPTSPSTKGLIAIDPIKAALVIVDMQNYFLSPSLALPTASP
jgi:hypothetical protein